MQYLAKSDYVQQRVFFKIKYQNQNPTNMHNSDVGTTDLKRNSHILKTVGGFF